MRGTINLIFEDFGDLDYSLSNVTGGKTYTIDVFTELDTPFLEIINDKDKFNQALDMTKKVFMDNEKYYDENFLKLIDEHKNGNIDLLREAKFIDLDCDYETFLEYLEKNPSIKNMNLIASEVCELDSESLNSIKEKYNSYFDNIYIRLRGNFDIVSIEECEKTIKVIDSIVENIKNMNLSAFEKVIYVYDLVRDKVYAEEDTEEDTFATSRDLTASLFGDKIVCTGYANLFNTILDKLNIKTVMCSLNSTLGDPGHSRSAIYIKDEKYDIDGIYFFDPTWDSKQGNDNKFLYSYRFLAKTKKDIEKYSDHLIDTTFNAYDSDFAYEFENKLDKNGIDTISREMAKAINNMSRFIDGKQLIDINYVTPYKIKLTLNGGKDDIISKVWDYSELLNRPISANKFLDALYNVRKIQYCQNPKKYPFDVEYFYCVAYNSGFKFEEVDAERLLSAIFGENKNNENFKYKMYDYCRKTDLNENIEQEKAKVLRKVSNND